VGRKFCLLREGKDPQSVMSSDPRLHIRMFRFGTKVQVPLLLPENYHCQPLNFFATFADTGLRVGYPVSCSVSCGNLMDV